MMYFFYLFVELTFHVKYPNPENVIRLFPKFIMKSVKLS